MTVKTKRSSKKRTEARKANPVAGPAKIEQSSQKRRQAKKLPARKAPASFWRLANTKFIILALVAISGLTFFVRCLHMLGTDHYFMISPDSHVFHWMALQVIEGQPLPHIPTGLVYPLAYGAMAISWVFKVTNEQALTFLSMFLPPFLGVISVVVMYLALSRMYDRRMGLAAAFAMALLPHAYFVQAAGYIDRDPLNVLLLMAGVFAFYFSRNWQLRVMGRNAGWMLGVFAVLVIQLILYLQWSWMGPALLLVVILAYSVADLAAKYFEQPKPSAMDPYQSWSRRFFIRFKGAFLASRWQAAVAIVAGNVIGALVASGISTETIGLIWRLVSSGGGSDIAELGGFGRADLLLFQFFLLLIPVGFILALIRRRDADVLFMSWFLSLFVLSLFSRRVILLAIPAAAVMGGMVIANLFDFRYSRKTERRIQGIVTGMVVVILLGLSSFAHGLGNEQRVAANPDWQRAMTYLREETDADAWVMTWWDYGYWVLDMGQRRPVVDNGLYGHTPAQDRDIATAYCHPDGSKAVEMMKKHNADYLIFSSVEREIWAVIAAYGSPGKDPASVYQTSFYYKSLSGSYVSGENLIRVYPETDTSWTNLVIYQLVE